LDAEAACLILQDFYKEGGQGAYMVFPDDDVVPLEQADGSDNQDDLAPENSLEQASCLES